MGHLKNFVIMVGDEVDSPAVLLEMLPAAATARRESLRSCLKVFMLDVF